MYARSMIMACAVVPIGLVVNLADGHEKARMEVATGEYNKMIDNKIAAIKAQCGSGK